MLVAVVNGLRHAFGCLQPMLLLLTVELLERESSGHDDHTLRESKRARKPAD
jgi:hypothetical protein